MYAKDKTETSVMYLLYLHVFIKIPVMMRDKYYGETACYSLQPS